MLVFLTLAVVMIIGALGVVTLKQPVHAALSLVATLLTLAVTYVTLEAHFLAATQVIVYAGAIMVLFLFVIMLLNVQEDKEEAGLGWIRPAAYLVGVAAAAGIVITAFRNPSQLPDATIVSAALQGGGAEQIADALFSEFVLAFQLVGVLLLTGIIGATSLVQRKAVTVYGSPTEKLKVPVSANQASVAVLERPESSGHVLESHVVEHHVVESEAEIQDLKPVEAEPSVDEEALLEELAAKDELAASSEEVVSEPDVDAATEAEVESVNKEAVEAIPEEAEVKAEGEKEVKEEILPEPKVEVVTPEPEAKADLSDVKPEAEVIKKDNLKRISGVGPKLEGILNKNGVFTFAQIAAFTIEDIEELDEQLENFRGRIERDDWVSQAQELAAEKKNDV